VPKLVVDANMLLLFIVGSTNPQLLGVAKRVKEYRPSDYAILFTYLSTFSEIILLPNTVTEVSNLLGYLAPDRRQRCMELLALLTADFDLYLAALCRSHGAQRFDDLRD